MTAHVVGFINAVKDADKLANYAAVVKEGLVKHGGAPISATSAPKVLQGQMAQPKRLVILVFPSADAANAWMDDPDLAHVHALRLEAMDITLFLASGDA